MNKLSQAEGVLSSMEVSNKEIANMKYILHTQINIAKEKRQDVSDAEFTQLKLIDDARGVYANQARDMIHLYRGMHPFIKDKAEVNIDIAKSEAKLVPRAHK